MTTASGTVSSGADALYREEYRGQRVLWIPDEVRELHVRLLIRSHMSEAGHRGVDATLARLRGYCVWKR